MLADVVILVQFRVLYSIDLNSLVIFTSAIFRVRIKDIKS